MSQSEEGGNVNVLVITNAYNPFLCRLLGHAGKFRKFINWNLTKDQAGLSDEILFAQFNKQNELKEFYRNLEDRNSPTIWGLSFSDDLIRRKGEKGLFHIVLNLSCSANGTIDEELAESVLSEYRGTDVKQRAQISFHDFQQFIHIASNISVSQTSESKELLIDYIEALKKRDIYDTLISSHVSFKKLSHVAAAHAKLCLRNQVLVDDSAIR